MSSSKRLAKEHRQMREVLQRIADPATWSRVTPNGTLMTDGGRVGQEVRQQAERVLQDLSSDEVP